MKPLSILLVCLLLTSCATQDDAMLRQYAIVANDYIGQHFGTQLPDAELDRLHLIWGERSETIMGYAPRISIWQDLINDPAGAQWHMNHEMFHVVSELSDEPERYKDGIVPQYFNDIRISDWVTWRKGP